MPRISNRPAKDVSTKYAVRVPRQFVDPYPEIPGTRIEKMVYAEMRRRGIPFQFQENLLFEIPLLETRRTFRADFSIPSASPPLIVNINGTYWHTKDAQIDKDATVAALAQMAGWRVVTWWEQDIETNLQELFNKDPYLQNWPGQPAVPHRSPWHTDSAGIKTLNRRRYGRIRANSKAVKVKLLERKRRYNPNRYTV